MLKSLLGSKIGMTRVFDAQENKVIPVTAVLVGEAYVTQLKNVDNDGYCAIQVGIVKAKFAEQEPSEEWFKNKADFFRITKEVKLKNDTDLSNYKVGMKIQLSDLGLNEGGSVKVVGTSKALGFQGVMRRHGFTGGPSGHSSRFHRRPGSSGCMRKGGELWKGRRLPGKMGGNRVCIETKVIKLDQGLNCVFVKGSVPGKKGFDLEIFATN